MNQSFSGTPSRDPRDNTGQNPTDSRLFEKVLQETAAQPETPDDADWQALLEVARRNGEASFVLEPVLVEMVDSLLRLRALRGGSEPQDWQPMVRRIAGTLFDDEPSRERLENLWNRLREAVR